MMGLDSPDPTRTQVCPAYHLSVGRQSIALGGGASVSGRVGSGSGLSEHLSSEAQNEKPPLGLVLTLEKFWSLVSN